MDLSFIFSCNAPSRPPAQSPGLSPALIAWWASQVLCVTVEEVPEVGEERHGTGYYVLNTGLGRAVLKVSDVPLRGAPTEWLGTYNYMPIVSSTELRQNFWTFQPDSWITYHVATVLEVDGFEKQNLFILVERIDDRLEIMMGAGPTARSWMMEFRATRQPRKHDRCHPQPSQVLAPLVNAQMLFEWIGSELCLKWKPYHILQSNCQHIAEDLQCFLRDPSSNLRRRPVEPLRPQGGGKPFDSREQMMVLMSPPAILAGQASAVRNFAQPVPSVPAWHPVGMLPVTQGSLSSVPVGSWPGQELPAHHAQRQDCVVQ